MKRIWFTSDTHYGHWNIIEYCNRPFTRVDDMNEAMIQRWNDRVAPEDLVYHLGDFAMGDVNVTLPIGRKLNGRKILIMGNHDRSPRRMIKDAGFEEVAKRKLVAFDGYRVCMQHYPLGKDEPWGDFDYRLCGHIHEKWKNRGAEINVGVDVWDFTPHTFAELIVGIAPHYGKRAGL